MSYIFLLFQCLVFCHPFLSFNSPVHWISFIFSILNRIFSNYYQWSSFSCSGSGLYFYYSLSLDVCICVHLVVFSFMVFFFLTGLHFFHLLLGVLLFCLLLWSCSFSFFYLTTPKKREDKKKLNTKLREDKEKRND